MDPFLGQIEMFGGNYAPRSWALCDGQLLAISSNTALFSILGTTYGGDGRTTFGLPDLRGRVAMHPGSGPGLTPARLGEKKGNETTTLSVANMPTHNHGAGLHVSSANATQSAATAGSTIGTPGAISGRDFAGTFGFNAGTPDVAMNAGAVTTANNGSSQAFSNEQPSTAVNYIICINGEYPSRN